MVALLAFDTATERIGLALQVGVRVWSHDAAGGAQASLALLPALRRLLAEAGIGLRGLDAIAFGRGPGAFTGLRTACAVAQGLAFGAGLPVLPLDTLMAVAEDARLQGAASPLWVVMDARMGEIYAAEYDHDGRAGSGWHTLTPPRLTTPEALNAGWAVAPPQALAGSAIAAFGDRLLAGPAALFPAALPTGRALLPLGAALWAQGGAVDAALALPLYLRDKVALTTAERAAIATAKVLG